MKKIFIFLFAALRLCSAEPLFAATIPAATCQTADINAAIARSAPGDTITVPAGKCTLTGPLEVFDRNLVGAGATDAGTVLTIDGLTNVVRHPKRLTGFYFILLSGAEVVNTAVTDMRIDHNVFDNRTGEWAKVVIFVGNNQTVHPDGVIDHNTFIMGRVLNQPAFDGGDKYWKTPSSIGQLKGRLYVEDNVFTGDNGNVIDENAGGCYVFRHNKVTDSVAEAHSKQGPGRASRCWEVYENDFTTTNPRFTPFFLRAGTGVVFNNRINGPYSFAGAMDNLLSFLEGYGPLCTVYPCDDQLGRGQDQPDGSQLLEPAYWWNNTLNGVVTNPGVSNCAQPCWVIQEGRDYHNKPRPGYTPAPYPHPLVASDGTQPNPIPEPDPQPTPVPPVNKAPTVTITAPTPDQIITTKSFTITALLSDDVECQCVDWVWLYIKGVLVNGYPKQGLKSTSFTLNTSPLKGKGPFDIKVVVRDAEGLEGRDERTATVKK